MWLLLILDVLDTRDTALAMSFTTILREVLATIKIPTAENSGCTPLSFPMSLAMQVLFKPINGTQKSDLAELSLCMV